MSRVPSTTISVRATTEHLLRAKPSQALFLQYQLAQRMDANYCTKSRGHKPGRDSGLEGREAGSELSPVWESSTLHDLTSGVSLRVSLRPMSPAQHGDRALCWPPRLSSGASGILSAEGQFRTCLQVLMLIPWPAKVQTYMASAQI